MVSVISVPVGAQTRSTGARSRAHTTVMGPAAQPSGRVDPVTELLLVGAELLGGAEFGAGD
jgi:hypothetical protein